jgi:hypothetical protein
LWFVRGPKVIALSVHSYVYRAAFCQCHASVFDGDSIIAVPASAVTSAGAARRVAIGSLDAALSYPAEIGHRVRQQDIRRVTGHWPTGEYTNVECLHSVRRHDRC